ncbi:MAG TPA: hypothetical protein VFD13_05145 [Candidatus Kapabacteria bacterium]|nr:hypothetical protein [Candidatus Kapabacteria bacterium]
MKKSALKKNRISNRSKMAIAGTATMAALPMLGVPIPAKAQHPGVTTTIPSGDRTVIKQGQYLKYADQFVKMGGTYSIAGVNGEHIVYRKAGGEYFFIDPSTGDMKFVSASNFDKWPLKNAGTLDSYTRKKLPGKMKSGSITITRDAASGSEAGEQFSNEWLKDHREDGSVKILGVDAAGHDVLQTSNGETVYLDPRTGDFVSVR